MTPKEIFKKIWKSDLLGPALIVGAFVYIFVSKDGFLLSYLKASGWLIFLASLILTIVMDKKIKNWLSSKGKSRYWSGILQIPLFFVVLYSLHTISDHAVRISGYPDYVLFPCSHEPKSSAEIKEAKNFWKMREFEQFNCDPDSTNEGF